MNATIPRFVILALAVGIVPAICSAQGVPATASGRFEILDTNRDGVLSKYEYDSSRLFKALDSDHNNSVSATELEAAIGAQADGAASAADRIRLADTNTDGELNEEELRRTAEMRFQRIDANQDGNVDLAEMKSNFGRP